MDDLMLYTIGFLSGFLAAFIVSTLWQWAKEGTIICVGNDLERFKELKGLENEQAG